MENELNENNLNEYFMKVYDKQNLKNNPNYLKWKELKKKKYGKNAKFIHCKKDNIIFVCSDESLKKNPIYRSNCPVCNNPICYFCSSSDGDKICCVKLSLMIMFLENGFKFIRMEENVENQQDYKFKFILFILPFINLFLFIHEIQLSLFYRIVEKESEKNSDSLYELKEEDNYISSLVFGITIAFDILLCIPYFILSIYFMFLLLIFSAPFKNYPLKYFIGIAYKKCI